jgi:hypothetical protein
MSEIRELEYLEIEIVCGGFVPAVVAGVPLVVAGVVAVAATASAAVSIMEVGEKLHDAFCKH